MNRRALLGAAGLAGVAALPSGQLPAMGVRGSSAEVVVAAQPVLAVFAHPDDETIAFGLDMRKHLEAGRDCHLLMCTRGTGSGVRAQLNGTGVNATWGMAHDPAAEGYTPLDGDAFGAARIAETLDALAVVASGTGRTVTVHEAGLTDGAVVTGDVMAAILDAYARICPAGGPLWLKTHTDIRSSTGGPLEHPDHTAAADACRRLSVARPDAFSNLRMYVEPENWANPVVTGHIPAVSRSLPAAGTSQAAAARNAAECFRAWAPGAGRYAIGHQSVASLFLASPENRYHS